jgi:hypothetical protein
VRQLGDIGNLIYVKEDDMTLFGLEILIVGKIAAALKGAAIVSAHHGLSMAVVKGFLTTAHTSGLVAALHWLIATLAGVAGTAAIIAACEKLIEAIETGEPGKAITAVSDMVQAIVSFVSGHDPVPGTSN